MKKTLTEDYYLTTLHPASTLLTSKEGSKVCSGLAAAHSIKVKDGTSYISVIYII